MQRATTLKDFISYMWDVEVEAERRHTELLQHLESSKGKHTFIILEGLDEMPKHLITQPSIFTRLLEGTKLFDATILVTSRPSATTLLWKKWKDQINGHIYRNPWLH